MFQAKKYYTEVNISQEMGHVMRKLDFAYGYAKTKAQISFPVTARNCTIYVAKAKMLISCAITAQLICIFCFSYRQKSGFLMTQLKMLKDRTLC